MDFNRIMIMCLLTTRQLALCLLPPLVLLGCESSNSETVIVPGAAAPAGFTERPEPTVPTEPTIGAANPTPGSLVIVDNNNSGGGFQSDVTITEDGLTVYSSADVSGVFKSTNGGLRFGSRNAGLRSTKIASLAITPDNDQILYAGTGDKGGSGGLFRSVNGGEFWTLTGDGDEAHFAGNHSALADPVPDGHPRSNGDLIIVDPGSDPAAHTDDIVIAGSYKTGVRIFTQGGEREVSAVNTSGFVRALAHDPVLPDTVFAAIQFATSASNGIYKIDYSNPSAPVSTLEYATPLPEGLAVLESGNVYGAIGTNGIVKYDGSDWELVDSGLATGNRNRQWTAVTGYSMGSVDIVYAGTTNLGGRASGSDYSNVWRSVDGGSSWEPLVDVNDNVSDRIYGQSYDWWYRTAAFKQGGLGRTNSVVSSLEVARGADVGSVSDDIVYVSGRGGLWKSNNGGGLWEPAVFNMQATSNNDVAVNPNNPSQVVLANTDYVVLETRSAFQSSDVSRDKPQGAESKGFDVIFDEVANELILGVGDRDRNEGGELFIKSATALGNPSGSGWTNTNLGAATAANDGRVRAVGYGYHDGTSATTQTVLAVVEGEGVYRYHRGRWTKSSGVAIGDTDRSQLLWPDNGNSGIVYLLDLSAGLYRSEDGGQSWEDMWPTMRFNNNDFFHIGFIAADDSDATTVYLSIQGSRESSIGRRFKVYRLTDADRRIFGEPDSAGIVDISSHSENVQIKRPGPMVVGPNGLLWLTEQQDSKNDVTSGLFVMENPTSDTSFTEVTPAGFRSSVITPSGIDVSSDGNIYVSQSGKGVIRMRLQ